MPVQLQTQFCRATVVFDATGYMTDTISSAGMPVKAPVVETQFREMFSPKEYWYLPETEFSPTASEGAAEAFIELLRDRLNGHALINTQPKLNLFFYFRLEDMPVEKTKALKYFIDRVALILRVPTLELHSYIVADKYSQNSEKAMQNLMGLADRFLEVQDTNAPQLILLESLPLERVDAAVRATVRVANILSRNGVLYETLRRKTAEHLLWNWTMSEFDAEALSEITEELESIRHRLSDNGPFPGGELQNNLRTVWRNEEQRNIGSCSLNAENIPVPAAAIRRCLFGTKAADEAATSCAEALRETYRRNMERRCFPRYAQEEAFEICRQMTENIPLNHWKSIKTELLSSLGEVSKKCELPYVSLHHAPSLLSMREQIADQIKQLNKAVRNDYPQRFALFIASQLDDYMSSEEAKQAEKRLRDRESELQLRISDKNGVKEGTEYLANIMRISNALTALYFLSFYEKSQYILISNRINAQWSERYASCLPLQISAERDVYNYMDLQKYEFQTLTLLTFRREELEAGKHMMFRLEGANEDDA